MTLFNGVNPTIRQQGYPGTIDSEACVTTFDYWDDDGLPIQCRFNQLFNEFGLAANGGTGNESGRKLGLIKEAQRRAFVARYYGLGNKANYVGARGALSVPASAGAYITRIGLQLAVEEEDGLDGSSPVVRVHHAGFVAFWDAMGTHEVMQPVEMVAQGFYPLQKGAKGVSILVPDHRAWDVEVWEVFEPRLWVAVPGQSNDVEWDYPLYDVGGTI